MQSLPLSGIETAAALVAIGVPVTALTCQALHHTGTGERRHEWALSPSPGADLRDIADLLRQHRQKTLPATHPLFVALLAIANMAPLYAWLRDPLHPPDFDRYRPAGSGFIRLHHPPSEQRTSIAVMDRGTADLFATHSVPIAAAFMTCGFFPRPHIQDTGRGPLFVFRESSLIYHDISITHFLQAIQAAMQPGPMAPTVIPGAPAGQHPFHYALAATANMMRLPAIAARADASPTHFFQGRGQRCATVNNAFLKNPRMEAALAAHLA